MARGRALPGLGLSNLVVPLGDSLIEIHYPDGREPEPSAPPLLRIDRARLSTTDAPLVPVAWIVAYEDEVRLRQLATSNDAPVHEAPAEGPGFPPYVLAGFGATFDRPWLPALIHWPVPPHERPAALPAPHRRSPSGITRLEVAGDEEEVRNWCGELPAALSCRPGATGPLSVTVGFADGSDVTFGTGP